MKHISKFLSVVLRHQPEKIGLVLDKNGWAVVDELLDKLPMDIDLSGLKQVVDTNDKQRFTFNDDFTKIRANQGHSINHINLDLEPLLPPEILYHGTVPKFIENIKNEGLKRMNRQHVHLSGNRDTANKVGSRRGQPIILQIRALEMFKDGLTFYKSKNGVWLTNHVPVNYIIFKS